MYVRLTTLAAALISCTSSAWAALPTHETYSAADLATPWEPAACIPAQFTSDLLYFNTLSSTQPWPMDAVNPIASYLLGASPYNDTSILFSSTPTYPTGGIPAIEDPSFSLGGDTGMGFPTYDLVLNPVGDRASISPCTARSISPTGNRST